MGKNDSTNDTRIYNLQIKEVIYENIFFLYREDFYNILKKYIINKEISRESFVVSFSEVYLDTILLCRDKLNQILENYTINELVNLPIDVRCFLITGVLKSIESKIIKSGLLANEFISEEELRNIILPDYYRFEKFCKPTNSKSIDDNNDMIVILEQIIFDDILFSDRINFQNLLKKYIIDGEISTTLFIETFSKMYKNKLLERNQIFDNYDIKKLVNLPIDWRSIGLGVIINSIYIQADYMLILSRFSNKKTDFIEEKKELKNLILTYYPKMKKYEDK